MSENVETPAVTEPPAAASTPPADPTPTEAAKSQENPWDNPEAAKAEIERLRRENAKDRTNAKAQAADAAKQELSQQIAKALGIVTEETPTPEQLTQNLTAAQQEAKQARIELAVFRSAAAAGADPAALLDSASFLASLAAVDPSDASAVSAAIASAVEANPRLGAAGPRPPAPNPAQGASAQGAPAPARAASLEEAIANKLAAAAKRG